MINMATKSAPKKASAAKKRFVADPTRGLHPDTHRVRTEEMKVLTPLTSPSRIGFHSDGIRTVGGPKNKKTAAAAAPAANSVPPSGGPTDHAMGDAEPRKAARPRKAGAPRKVPAKKSAKAKAKA